MWGEVAMKRVPRVVVLHGGYVLSLDCTQGKNYPFNFLAKI